MISLLFSVCLAKIPSEAFNDLGKNFKEGYAYLNPLNGQLAIESGFIHSYRFFALDEKGKDKDGNPSPIADKGNDPLWKLVKILFPSPAGTLATETTSETNIGKRISDPRIVAHLLKYAFDCKAKLRNIESSQQTLQKQIADLDQDITKLSTQDENSKALKTEFIKLQKELAQANPERNKQINARLNEIRKQTDNNAKKLIEKKKEERRKAQKSLVDNIQSALKTIDYSDCKKLFTEITITNQNLQNRDPIEDFISCLQQAINDHMVSNLVDEVILAFFAQHFNLANDMKTMLTELQHLMPDALNNAEVKPFALDGNSLKKILKDIAGKPTKTTEETYTHYVANNILNNPIPYWPSDHKAAKTARFCFF